MNDIMQKQMLAMLGGGMANQAGQAVQQMPDYKMYVVDAQSAGVQPLPMNDPNWMQHYQQMMNPQPQGLLSP